jgi:hypothetical protein
MAEPSDALCDEELCMSLTELPTPCLRTVLLACGLTLGIWLPSAAAARHWLSCVQTSSYGGLCSGADMECLHCQERPLSQVRALNFKG